ncbi:hypothetical protein ACHQM5_025149 [Ranunculus cassubicifolius]
MDPIERAREGDVNYFRETDRGVILEARDRDGCSALDTAVMHQQIECCVEICRRCPGLLYNQSREKQWTALHHAAYRGYTMIITSLINAADENERPNMEGGGGEEIARRFLRMVDIDGKNSLYFAVEGNQLAAAKMLMEADPDFQYSAGFDSPLLHAMKRAKLGNRVAAKIRKLILEKQPYHAKIRGEPKNRTPLHISASNGDLDAIEEMIRFCPECTELVDDESQNFLHIAAQFGHTKVVTHVLDTKDIALNILNAQDANGETPLHIAASSGNKKMTLALLYDDRVFKNTENTSGQKVLDAVPFNYDKKKAKVYGVRDKVNEKDLKEQNDFDLVVGALIAAVSFTAGITVPGGYISSGEKDLGMAILSKESAFIAFVVSNTLGLLLSLYAVFSHFCVEFM